MKITIKWKYINKFLTFNNNNNMNVFAEYKSEIIII